MMFPRYLLKYLNVDRHYLPLKKSRTFRALLVLSNHLVIISPTLAPFVSGETWTLGALQARNRGVITATCRSIFSQHNLGLSL